ncbi:VRR-NUC domain-containing protein [Ideonella livida]|uniref:VRR-NUC domain-containing protein n=1 Tax=Ideonella livida TaxID=2707176 RepID=A0A7C9PEI1_9BURK|nr:VRR-NUC domain-containing protein [Ideonella livida]NDY89755.1 VRR-NUC domain-containing protein [Ideonella livida]
MRDVEHAMQAAFVRWTSVCRIPEIELSHAVPNGGQRSKATAGRLKAEGVKPGVPDWQWPVARGGYIGLAIEFKSPGEGPTKEQRDRINALQMAGWLAVLCWDWEAASRVVKGYAGMIKLEFS